MKLKTLIAPLVICTIGFSSCAKEKAEETAQPQAAPPTVNIVLESAAPQPEETARLQESQEAPKLVKNIEDVTYTNKYLGITVISQKDWYEVYKNEKNMNKAPELTETLEQLDYIKNADETLYFELIDIANNENPLSGNRITWSLVAQTKKATLDEVSKFYEDNMLNLKSETATIELKSKEDLEINGVKYKYLSFLSTDKNNSANNHFADFFIAETEKSFVINNFTYWEADETASGTVRNVIKNQLKLN